MGIVVSYTESGDLLISSGGETRIWPLADVLRAAVSAGAALGTDSQDHVLARPSLDGAGESTGNPRPKPAPAAAPASSPAPVTTQAEEGGWPKPLPGVTALVQVNPGATPKSHMPHITWRIVEIAERVELGSAVEYLHKPVPQLLKGLRAATRTGVIPTFAVQPSDRAGIRRVLRMLPTALGNDRRPQTVRIVFLAEELTKPLPE